MVVGLVHWRHLRFDNIEGAGRLQHIISDLKCSRNTKLEVQNLMRGCCSKNESKSESEIEVDDDLPDNRSNAYNSPKITESASTRSRLNNFEEVKDGCVSNFTSLVHKNFFQAKNI